MLVVALVPAGPVSITATGGCSTLQALTSGCATAAVGGGAVNLGGTLQTAGTNGNSGGSGGSGGGGVPFTANPNAIYKCGLQACIVKTPGSAPITLRDIASFRPTPGVQRMEPDGWMVVGLDANFYALTDQHIVNGTLLGQPASVRFTPVAFHWSYGDGEAATRGTKGATWLAQGIHEFDPTPTSHVYQAEGEYTIRLVIDFAAEYRFAGSAFMPISGTLPLPANDLHVSVGSAKTVLVEDDCGVNPGGPGC